MIINNNYSTLLLYTQNSRQNTAINFNGQTSQVFTPQEILTHRNINSNYLTGQNLYDFMKTKPQQTYIGEVPKALLAGNNQQQVLKNIDELAQRIHSGKLIENDTPEALIARLTGQAQTPEIYTAKIGNKHATFKYLAGGTFADVYKVSVQNNDFALKVYKQKPLDGERNVISLGAYSSHGVWAETANLIETKNAKIVDTPDFHLANPHKESTWQLIEYIPDKNYQMRTNGPDLLTFLDTKGLLYSDDINLKANQISGVFVDLGGIREKEKGYLSQKGL